ncbi:MAG: SagB/ThcOx family dehydrogenase [Desulfobacterales bacterium]|nr:SagB/ThcOx family dehydrogenase [Desulfobacterales bacterium]
MAEDAHRIKLPPARTDGSQSLESTLNQRRSVRSFADAPVTLPQLAQLLWAGQGLTDRRGYRTAPSAGATYPLELLAAVGDVDGFEPGIYRYLAAGHYLEKITKGDPRPELQRAALSQSAVAGAPVVFVISAVYERTLGRYGERGIRYVHMEAGHAAQNICLQAVALGLGSVVIGAFRDRQIQQVLSLDEDEHPLYLIPVGR